MKHRLPCELIQDLFPSYIDGLTSDVTNELLEEHIKECPICCEILGQMQETTAESVKFEEKKEIDFLKKTKKTNQKKIWGSIIGTVVAIVTIYLLATYVIGYPTAHDNVKCEVVSVEGKKIVVSAECRNPEYVISKAAFRWIAEDDEIEVVFNTVKRSPLYEEKREFTYMAPREFKEVCVGGRMQPSIWYEGNNISMEAGELFDVRNPYIGQAFANSLVADALELSERFGVFSNELQTSAEPYEWKVVLQEQVPSRVREEKEQEMRSCGYLMLASVQNVGSIAFEYESEGKEYLVNVTVEEASEYIGRDIKECYENPVLLQELLEKTGLDFEHNNIRIRAKKVMSPAYRKEILRQLREYEQVSGTTILPKEEEDMY